MLDEHTKMIKKGVLGNLMKEMGGMNMERFKKEEASEEEPTGPYNPKEEEEEGETGDEALSRKLMGHSKEPMAVIEERKAMPLSMAANEVHQKVDEALKTKAPNSGQLQPQASPTPSQATNEKPFYMDRNREKMLKRAMEE